MSKILKISNLYKNYNTKKMEIEALKNVNIEINEGDFLGIVGPSGCGKSTLLKTIARINKPTNGDIFINNKNIKKVKEKNIAKNRWEMSNRFSFYFPPRGEIPRAIRP